MSISVDARGRSCPEPVMMIKQALEQSENEDIEIMVSSKTAVDNIERYVRKENYEVFVEEKEEDFLIVVKR